MSNKTKFLKSIISITTILASTLPSPMITVKGMEPNYSKVKIDDEVNKILEHSELQKSCLNSYDKMLFESVLDSNYQIRNFLYGYFFCQHPALFRFSNACEMNDYSLGSQAKNRISNFISSKTVYDVMNDAGKRFDQEAQAKAAAGGKKIAMTCWSSSSAFLKEISGLKSELPSDTYTGMVSTPLPGALNTACHIFCYIYFDKANLLVFADPLLNTVRIVVLDENVSKNKNRIQTGLNSLIAEQLQRRNEEGVYSYISNLGEKMLSVFDKMKNKIFNTNNDSKGAYLSQYIYCGNKENDDLKNTKLSDVKWMTCGEFISLMGVTFFPMNEDFNQSNPFPLFG